MLRFFSVLIGLILLWFSGSQIYVIRKGMIVQVGTFYSTMIIFITGVALLITGSYWIIVMGIIFYLLMHIVLLPFTSMRFQRIIGGWCPSAYLTKAVYFLISSGYLFLLFPSIARSVSAEIIPTAVVGYMAYFSFIFDIGNASRKNIKKKE